MKLKTIPSSSPGTHPELEVRSNRPSLTDGGNRKGGWSVDFDISPHFIFELKLLAGVFAIWAFYIGLCFWMAA